MGIGGSIFLIAVGAIIAFGVNIQLGWLDLSVVGWVLMLAGFVGLILTIWFWNSRRRRVVVRPADREVVHGGPNSEVVAEDNWAQPPDRRV
jgi:protein-S-isoprenylcysteine O-methyltransferase Ste14